MQVDISNKKTVSRQASASGKIYLKNSTIKKISANEIDKGNVFQAAEMCAISAVNKTSQLIPYCHTLNIENTLVTFNVSNENIEVLVTVKAFAKTGVEMEALIGVSIALNTIWDMVKYLEKDDFGLYPNTRITDIKVVQKIKGK